MKTYLHRPIKTLKLKNVTQKIITSKYFTFFINTPQAS